MHTLRRGCADDLPFIYRMERLYVETMEVHQLQNWLANLERHLQQWVEDLPRTTIVETDDRTAGYLFWEREHETAILASINIDPSYRRMGLATALLERFEQEAATEGCLNLELGFLAHNPARILYEASGYLYHREEAPYVFLCKKTSVPA